MPDLTKLRRYRESLQEARFNGTRAVQDSNGQRLEYKSDAEMARALAAIDSEIAALQQRRTSIIKMQTSKGL